MVEPRGTPPEAASTEASTTGVGTGTAGGAGQRAHPLGADETVCPVGVGFRVNLT